MLGKLALEGLKGFGSDNPGGDGGGKVLGVEGAERNVLPDLEITARPIVKESVSEDVLFGFSALNRCSKFVAHSDDGSHLELKIESVALGPRRGGDFSLTGRGTDLTLRSTNGSSINNDG